MRANESSGVVTRRQFVATGALGAAFLATGCKVDLEPGMEFLTHEEARTLAAICDQIVPADEFASASQAGVVHYIDRQLMRFYRPLRAAYREGLKTAQETARRRFARSFEDLNQTEQFEAVLVIEKDRAAFFEMVRRHTFEGYYGSPRHGGNRDAVSWRMLGLDEPPLLGRAQYDLREGGRK